MKKVVKLTKVGYSFAPVFPLLALVFIFSSVSAATGNENFNEYFCHISSTDKKNNEKNKIKSKNRCQPFLNHKTSPYCFGRIWLEPSLS